MTQLQAIRNFMDTVCGEPIVIARERDDWAMDVFVPRPRLILPYDLCAITEQDVLFRQDFISRCKYGDDFADITLSLLHEAGHWFTRYQIDWEAYYEQRLYAYDMDYFRLDAEMQATDWAINWLSKKKHRALAKHFEANFFNK